MWHEIYECQIYCVAIICGGIILLRDKFKNQLVFNNEMKMDVTIWNVEMKSYHHDFNHVPSNMSRNTTNTTAC